MYLNPKELSKERLDLNSKLRLFQIYKNLKQVSLKSDTYFHVYEEIFNRYVGKKITFVEIGVLQGGSLHMWREYFGSNARIIGIDLNPKSKIFGLGNSGKLIAKELSNLELQIKR